MKKWVVLIWSLTGLICFCLISLIIVLRTSLLTTIVQSQIRSHYLPDFHVQEVDYIYPFQLRFQQVQLSNDGPFIETINTWINPNGTSLTHLDLDSILINHLTLSVMTPPSLPSLPYVSLAQLAIKNLDIIGTDWKADNTNIQIEHPTWSSSDSWLPNGKIQSYIETFSWKKETFHDLLINADHRENNSVIYGLSAKWLNGDISLQAQQNAHNWTILSLNASNIHLNNVNYIHLAKTLQSNLSDTIGTIQRIDILNSEYRDDTIDIGNLNLSLDNLTLGSALQWQQENAVLSASADSISYKNLQWIDPNLQAELTPNNIKVIDLSGQLLDGNISLSGTLTPTQNTIDWLQLQNIKYFIESEQDEVNWSSWLANIDNLTIKHASIKGSQMIQLRTKPFWQLSGIDMQMNDAHIIQDHHLSMWSGDLDMNVNNLSYDGVLSTGGELSMNSDGHTLNLDNLSIPLKNGQISAHGQWHFSETGGPWTLQANAQNTPAGIVKTWLSPLSVEGELNASLNVNGNVESGTLDRHSIEGDLHLQIAQGKVLLPNSQMAYPFALPDTTITSHQGQMTITPTPLQSNVIKGQIEGHMDFNAPDAGQVRLTIEQGCQKTDYEFIKKATQTTSSCHVATN